MYRNLIALLAVVLIAFSNYASSVCIHCNLMIMVIMSMG
jgi:hypothetical protein